MSSSNLIRWSGLASIVSGLFVGLGFILHPPEEAASVSTNLWTIAQALLLASLLFGIVGLFGLYMRQGGPLQLFVHQVQPDEDNSGSSTIRNHSQSFED
jgi:hypothetical protein